MSNEHLAEPTAARRRRVVHPQLSADATQLRRLPVVPSPVEGEAFHSWVDRAAIKLDLPPGFAARALGLEFNSAGKMRRPLFFGVTLTPASLAGLQLTTGLTTKKLWQMQLARYDGTALNFSRLDLNDVTTLPRLTRHQWFLPYASRACPHCLSGSAVWPVWWRLGIAAVCPVHRRLLVDICPACGVRLRRGSGKKKPGGLPTGTHYARDPQECGNRSPNPVAASQPEVCRQRITDIPTLSVPQALVDLQVRALAIADGGTARLAGEPVSGAEWFDALRYLTAAARLVVHDDELAELPGFAADALAAVRTQRALTPRARPGGSGVMPGTASEAAAALALTEPILNASDWGAGASHLAPWARRLAAERQTRHSGRNPLRGIQHPAGLHRMMTAIVPHHYRIAGAVTTGSSVALEFRHIPNLIDADDYRNVMAVHLPGITPVIGRHFCSLALARLAGAATWAQAEDSLETLNRRKGNWGKTTQKIPDSQAFWNGIRTLADLLRKRGAIDYAARRRALSELLEVPYDSLFSIFRPVRMGVTRQRQRHAAAWVWQALTGSPAHDSPVYAGGWEGLSAASMTEARRKFHERVPESAARALTLWGLEWLDEKGTGPQPDSRAAGAMGGPVRSRSAH
ncbi:TniQ family protein [Streptomyces massasporeus]|uniref:TniQ family protein n=1 Tax=Streptomyces massasporeus TaxID=67324 RepID=A0ABW6LMU2_9ACTN